MEDISRELEREIARAKPKPHKTSRKKKVLVVDDFGELKSGAYLRVMVYVFSIISLVGILSSTGLYYFYSHEAAENVRLTATVAGLEKKAKQLTSDKELLMARLVMSGNTSGLESAVAEADSPASAKEKKPGVLAKADYMNGAPNKALPAEAEPESEPEESAEAPAAAVELPDQAEEGDLPDQEEAGVESATSQEVNIAGEPIVAVEKFSVTPGGRAGEIYVRFDIRNIKKDPGGISGRIFTVLKPESGEDRNWVVVPKAPLENQMPSVYRKGQYFSISRFKPVKFTVKTNAAPESFKQAAIYIYGEDGNLIFDTTIKITGEEEN